MAQSKKADSLFAVIKKNPLDTNAAKAYITLSGIYFNNNLDSAHLFAEKGLELAQKNKAPKLIYKSLNSLGYISYYKGDYKKAIEYFQSYFKEAESNNNLIEMAIGRNNEGNVYIELGDYVSAIATYEDALALRKKAKDSSGIAMSYNNIGFIYKDLGDYEKATTNFFNSLRINEQLNDKPAQALTYSYLAVTYWRKKDYSLAHQNLNKAYAIQSLQSDEPNMAISLQTHGAVFADEKMYDSAALYFNKARAIHQKGNDLRQLALIHADIADLFARQNKFDSSIYYYQKGIELNNAIGNKRSQATLFTGIANAYLQEKNYALCKIYLDSAKQLIATTTKKEDYKNYYKIESDYYAATGNANAALVSLQKYGIYKDSLLNEQNQKAIADMQTKYDVDKKDKQIVLQQSVLAKRKLQLISLVGLILLLGLLGFSYYKRLKLKQAARLQQEIMLQQDAATQAVIEAEEKERKRIASDLHDGVGQLMTAAWLNIQAINSKTQNIDAETSELLNKTMHLVDESCKEVRAVSHNMMPNALLKKGLVNAVREFLQQINTKSTQINLQTENLHKPLPSHVETVLYRVIQESVNNVIKHAQATSLDISINQDEEGIDVLIEDNGKGFNFIEANKKEGIGLQNIKSRIEYLKGTVEWNTAENKGTLVAIHIPQTA
ncbi:MAG: tetratricopeptide repeat protein [Ferruginibacter sp.]|nr:tetratricopeptide repeat protein [Ferruginibacter sp.]